MSDSHHLGPLSVGEVEHTESLSDQIGFLCLRDDYSDIVLVVEEVHIPGHKVILAARSEYFRALLYGGMRESSQSIIELKGTSLAAFKILLRYIYTGHMTLTNLKEDMILDILGLAHQYGFVELETSISEYLKAILNIRNVCMIYDTANLFHLSSLAEVCCCFVDKHAQEIIQHESFLSLSAAAIKEMISRDSFCAPEVDIFRAVHNWTQHNCGIEPQEILACVRLPLMTLQDLLNIVRPTGLLKADVILDAIKSRTESRDTDLKYRGYLIPEENVASPKHGARVLHGEMKSALLDGDIHNYDMERGFTRHPIDDNNGQGILVKLGMQCIINHMRMLLWDRDMRSYAYYIEVSMDQKDWVRVVDHTRYLCHSWQSLYFEERVVKFIRIVGTHNTVNRVFHVVAFECMYTNKFFRLEKGLIVPSYNVATIASSACVIEGVSRSRNALINGDTENYDWDSGYTCHQLGSGAIVIQLAQPYMIDSMRLLLWDCDDRSYSYYVEVSIDQQHWTMVADKQGEKCKSWQTLCFTPRPVVFIRIVGTHNTANEVFHCVHFECPAQMSASSTPPLQETVEEVAICKENVKNACTKYSSTSPICLN